MRINKHSRSWATAGRRLFRERLKSQDTKESTISEEGNTLVERKVDMEPSAFSQPAPSLANADPTQRLLTVLGRFNRFVNLAETGSAPEHWSDDCMEQLINGVEIALAESWVDVKQALTDTARILQSYEDAGAPEKALPFLKKSYETLCLMVGDLIVGNVRSGVLEKWRNLYSDAVQELKQRGIALVDDGGGQAAAAPAQVPTQSPVFFEDDTVEEDRPFGAVATTTADIEIQAETAEVSAFDGLSLDMPGEFESVSDVSQSSPQFDEFMTGGMAVEQEEEQTEDSAPVQDIASPSVGDVQADFGSDELEDGDYDAVLETAPAEVPEEAAVSHADELAALPPLPDEFPQSTEATAQDGIELETETEPAVEKHAAAETGTVPETETLPIDTESAAPLEEKATTLDETPVEAATREEDPALELLRTANLALAKGDVSEAKMLALQLAAQMAALEQERAEEQVAAGNHELERIIAAIHEGDAVVEQAAQRLEQNAGKVREHEKNLQERKKEIETLQKQVAEVDARMAALEEEIRKLEEKRADEAQLGAELQADMEMAIYVEGELKQELAQLREAEHAAQAALEQAQRHVAHLSQNREERQAIIAEAEAEVSRKRKSLDDIRHTIDLVLGIVREEAPEKGVDTAPEEKAGNECVAESESEADMEAATADAVVEQETAEEEPPTQEESPAVEAAADAGTLETETHETVGDAEEDEIEAEAEIEVDDEGEPKWEQYAADQGYDDGTEAYQEDDTQHEQTDYDAYEDEEDDDDGDDWENLHTNTAEPEGSAECFPDEDGQQRLF